MSSTQIRKPKMCPQSKLWKSLFFLSHKMFKDYFTSHIKLTEMLKFEYKHAIYK